MAAARIKTVQKRDRVTSKDHASNYLRDTCIHWAWHVVFRRCDIVQAPRVTATDDELCNTIVVQVVRLFMLSEQVSLHLTASKRINHTTVVRLVCLVIVAPTNLLTST